jgi:hypothetical protein
MLALKEMFPENQEVQEAQEAQENQEIKQNFLTN